MHMSKKAYLWLAGSLSFLFLLVIVLTLLLPGLVDSRPIKEKLSAEIYHKTGINAELGSLSIHILPRPCCIVKEGRFDLPGKFSGTVTSVTIFPWLFPSLLGDLTIAEILVEEPHVNVTRSGAAPGEDNGTDPISLSKIESRLAPLMALASFDAKELLIEINRGRVDINGEQGQPFWIDDIDTRIRIQPDRLDVDMGCKSTLWESATLKGHVTSRGLIGKGKIGLKRFRPHKLALTGAYPVPPQIGDSEINLELAVEAKGSEDIRAEIEGTIPGLTLNRDEECVELKVDAMAGTIAKKGNAITLSIAKLNLTQPQMDVTGSITMDTSTPITQVHLQGTNADATAIRKAALVLWGNKRTARKIFNVVRGGQVPWISFDSAGSSFADLGKTKNFVLEGSMVDGVIFIPDVAIEVEHAQGSVVIQKGILEGWNLEGNTNGSHGRDGMLTLGLKRDEQDDAPFHLDIDIDADLAQLPQVLERAVKNEPFLRELALIRNPKGRALGRLVLGERLESVHTKVDIRRLSVQGHYQRVPFPIELTAGAFLYEGTSIAAESLDCKIGSTSVSSTSVSMDWGEKPALRIASSMTTRVLMDEMFPWLTSFESIKKGLKDFQDVKGTLLIDSMDLQGALTDPKSWRFKAKGSVEPFVMQTSFFPAAATITKGNYNATHEKLSLDNCHSLLLDATLEVSGDLRNYLGGRLVRDLSIQGTMGEQTNKWISNLVSMPSALMVRSPVAIQQAHLIWEKDGPTSFSGTMSTQAGPRFSIDLLKTAEQLTLNRLDITDENSKGSFNMKLTEGELDIGFRGKLSRASLDRLLRANDVLTGSIEGAFQGHIVTAQPGKSTADGELLVSGLDYQYGLGEPVRIENASLTATGHRLQVKPAILDWHDTRFTVDGTVDFLAKAFRMNLDVSTDDFRWEKPAQPAATMDRRETSATRPKYLGVPLDGIVRFKPASFTYDKLTWKPFAANLLLDASGLNIDITEANLCGIPTLGKIENSRHGVKMDVKLAAREQDLDSTLSCLWNKKDFMTGRFSLTGHLSARGAESELADKFQGQDLELSAKDGRIYRLGLLSKIFAVINFTELYRGKVPDLIDQGFAFETVKMEASLDGKKLVLDKGLLTAPSMRMAWQGDVDLSKKTLDLTVLVAPLRTVDKILGAVPLLGPALGGTLLSIPVKVSGDLEDPQVVPLSPSAVGPELVELMKRTVTLPIRVIEPIWK
jgi:hypothetical protein